MTEVFSSIMNRYNETSGASLRAITTKGLHNSVAPQGTKGCYVVFQLVSGVPDWTFTESMEDLIIQFSIYDNENRSPSTVCRAYEALAALFDDCLLTVTGYTHLYMWRDLQQLDRDEINDAWDYMVQYRLYLLEA